jgi:hypothetical protein
MASIIEEVVVCRPIDEVWEAVRDVGAIHSRLAPGFVANTTFANGARTVTFANGASVVEPIVSLDDTIRRLVWTAEGGATSHYNASMQLFEIRDGTRLVWIADFLPDSAATRIAAAMKAGTAAIAAHLGQDQTR